MDRFNHNKILTRIKGFVTPTRFEVELDKPLGMDSNIQQSIKNISFKQFDIDKYSSDSTSELIRLLVNDVIIPNMSFKTFTTTQNIAPNNRPYQINYAPVTITFNLDEDNVMLGYLWHWFNTVYDFKRNLFNFYDDYVADIYVHVYDKKGERIFTILFEKAYPSLQNEMAFNPRQLNTAQTISIMFEYKKMRIIEDGNRIQTFR